jgi:hypothetical protein
MTNPYLDRLRGRIQEKQYPSLPSKPSKPGFEGIEGDQGCHFSENGRPTTPKSTTSPYPQNLQNLRSPSVPGDGTRVTITEIPAKGLRFRRVFAHLQLRPPAFVPEDRWQMAIMDGGAFLGAVGRPSSVAWLGFKRFIRVAHPAR